ncbi:MAG: hypothetical protein U9Q15_03840 [Patescibacteria group bacterium]|nr:hypothetical protein [Patescibacteria group bacterium]
MYSGDTNLTTNITLEGTQSEQIPSDTTEVESQIGDEETPAEEMKEKSEGITFYEDTLDPQEEVVVEENGGEQALIDKEKLKVRLREKKAAYQMMNSSLEKFAELQISKESFFSSNNMDEVNRALQEFIFTYESVFAKEGLWKDADSKERAKDKYLNAFDKVFDRFNKARKKIEEKESKTGWGKLKSVGKKALGFLSNKWVRYPMVGLMAVATGGVSLLRLAATTGAMAGVDMVMAKDKSSEKAKKQLE